jgi:MspA
MFNRLATIAVVSMLVPCGPASLARADPDTTGPGAADAAPLPPPDGAPPPPPPPGGAVPSGEPAFFASPEGLTLTVTASKETQLAVNPLTTAISSREYLAGGTFTGAVKGAADTAVAGSTLEVGYQIGCGITADRVRLTASAGVSLQGSMFGLPTGVSFPVVGTMEVALKPGEVTTAPVTRKEFKGTDVRVTAHDIHIKIDGCAGQSFLRSYAVLTIRTDVTDDVVAYYGVTKAV